MNSYHFGGSFEFYIKKFENEYDDHEIELVTRVQDKGRTYIVPHIEKIEKVFEKLDLHSLFEEKALLNDPILIEYYDSYFPPYNTQEPLEVRSEENVEVGEERSIEQEQKDSGEDEKKDVEGEALIDETGHPKLLIDLVDPKGVYAARYYYKNGHPVFLKQEERTNIVVSPAAGHVDPDPFYTRTNFLYQKNIHESTLGSQASTVLASDQWNIKFESQEKNVKLREEYIQQLLKIGKDIVSNHPNRSFKIVLAYEGNLNES